MIDLTDRVLGARLLQLLDEDGADGARLYLEELRWPGGAECPRCESTDLLWLERRRRHQCRGCRYQFRVTTGTVFHDSHLPLTKWFLAVALMLESEQGISAAKLCEILGGSYKTAWFLEHRIRSALAVGGEDLPLPVAYAPKPAASVALETPRAAWGASAPQSFSLLRSLIAGAHLHLSLKYLSSYWDEVRWRDSNRSNPTAFRDTVRALLEHRGVTYEELTRQSPPAYEGAA